MELKPTKSEIATHYSSLFDSVDLINGVIAGTKYSMDPVGDIKRNQDHLEQMLTRDFWTDEDMSDVQTAVDIDADTVEITDYVPDTHVVRTTGTAREFMDLFTKEEKTKIVTMTLASPEIKLWYDEALAGDVYLGHPDVTLGLYAIKSAGVLTQERVEEILATDFDA